MRKFNHLNVPGHWEHYWSKYPEGYTILEALLNWVRQVDDMVDNVNDWNEYLEDFVGTFDRELQNTVRSILLEWVDDGAFDHIINSTILRGIGGKVNVGHFTVELTKATDNTEGIRAAIDYLKQQDYTTLYFPPGDYAYSEHINIDGLESLTIEMDKGAELYDMTKEVLTVSGNRQAPVGFSVTNVGYADINFNHDSPLPSDTAPVENPRDRVPHLEVKNVKHLKLHDSLLKSFTGVITQRSVAFDPEHVMRDYYIKMDSIQTVDIYDNELAEYAAHGEVFGVYNSGSVNFYKNKHRQESGGNTFWSFGKFILVDRLEIYNLDVKSNSPGSLFDGVVKKYAHIHDVNIDYVGHFFDCTNEWAGFNVEQQEYFFENCKSPGGGITSVMHHDDQTLNKKIKNLTLNNCNFGNRVAGSYFISSTMFENVTVKNTKFDSVRYLFDGRGRETKPVTQFDRTVQFIDCIFTQDYDINFQVEIDVYGKTQMINCHFSSPNDANFYFKDFKRIEQGITDMKSNQAELSKLELINCTFANCRLHYDVNTEFINSVYVNLLRMNIFGYNKPHITTVAPMAHAYSQPNKGYFPVAGEIKSTNPNELGETGSKYVITGWIKKNDGANNEATDWAELRAVTGN